MNIYQRKISKFAKKIQSQSIYPLDIYRNSKRHATLIIFATKYHSKRMIKKHNDQFMKWYTKEKKPYRNLKRKHK